MSDNRRRTPRASIDVLFNAFQEGLPALCAATDLSEGGLGLRRIHDNRMSHTDSVDVEFVLPGSEEVISARGHLKTRAGRSAVIFDWLADSHRAMIREFVATA